MEEEEAAALPDPEPMEMEFEEPAPVKATPPKKLTAESLSQVDKASKKSSKKSKGKPAWATTEK